MANSQFRVVLITAPTAEVADALASGLVAGKLAACVNVVPGVTSHYVREGQQKKDQEFLLVAKTRTGLVPQITAFVKSKHPAKVPETIALPLTEGSQPYLDWVAANTLFARAEEPKLPY